MSHTTETTIDETRMVTCPRCRRRVDIMEMVCDEHPEDDHCTRCALEEAKRV